MKQTITVLMTIFIYIGTIGLIDTSIAAGHHGKDGNHHGKPNPKMLFHGLDIDKEQKDQIKMINFIGDKYKRKVIKLYDIIDEEPIEIHNKINNKLKKIGLEF